jgi:hypothetical protein
LNTKWWTCPRRESAHPLPVTTAVYDAKFLDPARSAVFAVYLFLGIYFIGWIRVTRPKL